MTHKHLRFNLLNRFERNAHNDKKRCTADCKVADIHKLVHKYRQHRNYGKEYRARKRDFRQNSRNVIRGRSARTNTGNKSAVLLQIVRNLNRIELNCGIEIREEDYEQEVQYSVYHTRGREIFEDSTPESGVARVNSEERRDSSGERNNRHRKDNRNNARRRNLNRDMRALSAIHLSAHNALCVLNRNTSFGVGHPNNEADYDYRKHEDEQRVNPVVKRIERHRHSGKS